jgi:nucleoid DNA-binding protein
MQAISNQEIGVMAKGPEKKKPMTKSQILSGLAEATELSKKEIEKVFDALAAMINDSIRKTDDVFVMPGLLKIRNVRKKATKPRQGVNPKTGEAIEIPARPATNVVKVSALKSLKEMVKSAAGGDKK